MKTRWITRHGSKRSGFRYVTAAGNDLNDPRKLERIEALRIPPAWTDVHIAPSDRAEIQAWGMDAKGRRQYRYHPRAVERGAQRKYYRVRRLARDLPAIRETLEHALDGPGLTRDRVCAAAVHLLSEGFFRIGNEQYAAENRTFGLATMRKRHVRLDGDAVFFEYVGKGRIAHRQAVVGKRIAGVVRELLGTPGPRLFRYRAESGWQNLGAREVNDYIRRISGVRYSAKDFRTWGGTLRLATVLSELGPGETERAARANAVLAVRLVAAELGNTPAICRGSYVHPIVLARYHDAGETIRIRHKSGDAWGSASHSAEERALIRFLDRHFPERRRRRRPEELADRNGGDTRAA
jgi:DNA topoisomerase I